MNQEAFNKIVKLLENKFDDDDLFVETNAVSKQPYIRIKPVNLLRICRFLHETPELYFDTLNCISAVDNGVDKSPRFEVIYHLSSLLNEFLFVIMVEIDDVDNETPKVSSVNSVWKTADWHEREAFDLMGINFTNHPDLRRILLPADWVGHPLRKDYKTDEFYHGIKIDYE